MTSFKATGLGPEILSAVADLGYKAPTPIQEKAIPILLKSNSDLIALAQTGTGKTAAFGLPMLQRLDPNRKVIQALILCPTRELALQIVNDLASYSKNIAKLKVVAIYGGASAERQIQQLRQGAQVVVGTPGRTKDLIERKELDIRDIEWLVLDEADEMLDRGFKHDLDAILSSTPKDKRTLLFSATMPEHISEIARTYLYKPKQVSVARLNSGAENVSHRYYLVPPRERYRYLRQLLREMGDMYGIVFCRTKRKTREVARRLRRDGFSAGALEGDMPQNKRDRVMQRFRDRELNLLVATDVAARGVDIADLTHVINFNLPDEAAVYIHRSGRTGRAGKAGVSIALLSEEEVEKIQTLEKLAGKEFSSGTLEEVPEPRKQREPQAENDEGSPKEKPNKKPVERKPANREAGARQSPRNQRDDRNGNGRERPARDAVAPRENGRGRSGQGDVSGENERSRGRQDVKSERRSRGRDQQVDSQRDSRGRGRDQQEDSQRDSRGRGRDQQEDSQRDSRGRGRSRHSEAERNDGRRNSRDGRNGSQGRQNNDGRDSQTPQGEPLRRKTERAYDSVPVAMDSPASRRRSGGKKMPTPNEVKALIKAIKKANPNKKHLQKLMPAMLEQLDKYTWEEVIGKFVAYLDERGMLDEEKPKEKEAQPTGLKALFSSWRR